MAALVLVSGDFVHERLHNVHLGSDTPAHFVQLRRVEVSEDVAKEGRLAQAALANTQEVERLNVLKGKCVGVLCNLAQVVGEMRRQCRDFARRRRCD